MTGSHAVIPARPDTWLLIMLEIHPHVLQRWKLTNAPSRMCQTERDGLLFVLQILLSIEHFLHLAPN